MQSKKQSRGYDPHIVTIEEGGHTISMIPHPMFDIPKNMIYPVIPPSDRSPFPISVSKEFAKGIRAIPVDGRPLLLHSSHGQLFVHNTHSKEDFFEDIHIAVVSLETPYDNAIDPISDVTLSMSSYSWQVMASTGMIIYDASGGISYQVNPVDNGNK